MAGYYDFTIERRTTFKRTLAWTAGDVPVNNTTYTARLEARKNMSQPQPDFVLTNGDGITMLGANGVIDLSITPARSSELGAGIYFYWLDINTGDEVERLLEGRLTIKEGSIQ
jgi:hypothetical protein